MTKAFALIFVAALLSACSAETTSRINYGGGGGVNHDMMGGAPSAGSVDMDRLTEVEVTETETVREDTTPNDEGEQGTNGGNNSSNPDEFGKPDKISG